MDEEAHGPHIKQMIEEITNQERGAKYQMRYSLNCHIKTGMFVVFGRDHKRKKSEEMLEVFVHETISIFLWVG